MSLIKDKLLGFFVKTNGFFSKPLLGGRGISLMFHRVRPEKISSVFEQNKRWEITPEHLENIIKYFIKNNFNFIQAYQLEEALNQKNKYPFVIFTFDDGYSDNIEYAYPVFKKYNKPFTVFVTTSFVNKKRYPFELLLEDFLKHHDNISFTLEGNTFSYKILNDNEKFKRFSEIYKLIRSRNNKEQIENILNTVFGNYEHSGKNFIKIIEPGIIKQLSNDEHVQFDIHTANHYVMSQLSLDEQITDITEAQEYLKSLTSKISSVMAYPYGGPNDINKDTIRASHENGIKYGFTTWYANIFGGNHQLLVPRYTIEMKTDEKELNYLTNGIRHFSYNGFNRNYYDYYPYI